MHKYTFSAILNKDPSEFSGYLYHSKVLSEESYQVMTKLDGILPYVKAAVLSQFMKEEMINAVNKKKFYEAIRNDPSLTQLHETYLCIGKFIV